MGVLDVFCHGFAVKSSRYTISIISILQVSRTSKLLTGRAVVSIVSKLCTVLRGRGREEELTKCWTILVCTLRALKSAGIDFFQISVTSAMKCR